MIRLESEVSQTQSMTQTMMVSMMETRLTGGSDPLIDDSDDDGINDGDELTVVQRLTLTPMMTALMMVMIDSGGTDVDSCRWLIQNDDSDGIIDGDEVSGGTDPID